MTDFIDSLAKWLAPLFFLIYLLVDCYQARDKREWFKSSAKIFAIVLIILLPMGLIAFVAFFKG